MTDRGEKDVAGGARAVARCDILGTAPYSDMQDGLYRGYLSPAYAEAQHRVAEWMREAGMQVCLDAAANLVGRYEGEGGGPPLIIGSHLDSVRDAGRYDGPLGIMLGIECVAALHGEGRRLPFPIEVYAFGDEEGSRFPAAMTTSRRVADSVVSTADLFDPDGLSLDDALARYLDERGETPLALPHGLALAYLEAHIEQGPVLEAAGRSVGTVTGIAAQRRYRIHVTGMAGHAGTNAMSLRRDALAGAAAMVLAVEEIAGRGPPDLVATVGRIEALPGAANVVPGEVVMTLDIRAGRDAVRDEAAAEIMSACERIALARGLGFLSDSLQSLPASPCDARLIDLMDASIAAVGEAPVRLISGAGHDAMIMAALCPTAMIFIRCRQGISHNPAEHVETADVQVALNAMLHFIHGLS